MRMQRILICSHSKLNNVSQKKSVIPAAMGTVFSNPRLCSVES